MDIDKIEAGREMDALVAEAVGVPLLGREIMLKYCRKRIGKDNTTIVNGPDGTSIAYSTDSGGRFTPTSPRQIFKHYSTDIAASFEVDRPEWRWTFAEHPLRLTVLLWHRDRHTVMEANSTITIDRGPIATAHVKWDEVGTKAQAYALGRCRAALKAVEKERAMNKGVISMGEPVHGWFGLSYSQYLTVPRSVLQSMPTEWQKRFVQCLEEMDDAIDWRPSEGRYWVRLKDARGRFVRDSLMDYKRGRRRVRGRAQDADH